MMGSCQHELELEPELELRELPDIQCSLWTDMGGQKTRGIYKILGLGMGGEPGLLPAEIPDYYVVA